MSLCRLVYSSRVWAALNYSTPSLYKMLGNHQLPGSKVTARIESKEWIEPTWIYREFIFCPQVAIGKCLAQCDSHPESRDTIPVHFNYPSIQNIPACCNVLGKVRGFRSNLATVCLLLKQLSTWLSSHPRATPKDAGWCHVHKHLQPTDAFWRWCCK